MNIQGVLNIHRRDKWSWLYIPSIILFSSFFVNFIVSLLINNKEKFYTGGITSIFIYIFVLGIMVVIQSFPFAVGMSVRRKDYFFGTALMGLASSLILSVLLSLFAYMEIATNGWGNRFHFFHFPYFNGISAWERLVMYLILFTCFFFLGSLIASFTRRLSGKQIWVLAIAALLAGSIVLFLFSQFHVWIDIFHWLESHTAVEASYWLLPLTILSLIGSYLLLRRAAI